MRLIVGSEQCPEDLDSIADLQKLDGILARRGYAATDLDNIFHGNWLRLLEQSLPQDVETGPQCLSLSLPLLFTVGDALRVACRR